MRFVWIVAALMNCAVGYGLDRKATVLYPLHPDGERAEASKLFAWQTAQCHLDHQKLSLTLGGRDRRDGSLFMVIPDYHHPDINAEVFFDDEFSVRRRVDEKQHSESRTELVVRNVQLSGGVVKYLEIYGRLRHMIPVDPRQPYAKDFQITEDNPIACFF
jgi:hypothetical protein